MAQKGTGLAVEAAAHTTDKEPAAAAEDVASHMSKTYLQQELPTEVLCKIFELLPNLKSTTAAAMSCKRMYEALLMHQETIRTMLIKHFGEEGLNMYAPIVAAKTPYMTEVDVRVSGNVIEAVQSFWREDPYEAVHKGSRQPAWIKSWLSQINRLRDWPDFLEILDTKTWKQGNHFLTWTPPPGHDTTSVEPSSAHEPNDNNTPELQTNCSWYIDPVLSTMTVAQVTQIIDLKPSVQELADVFMAEKQLVPAAAWIPVEAGKGWFEWALWGFESYRRLFSYQFAWEQGHYSMLWAQITRPGFERYDQWGLDLICVYYALSRWVGWKWAAVIDDATECICPQEEKMIKKCRNCLRQGIDGALSMGLPAICRILRTGENDLEELKRCFIWEDGLPRRHPHFIGHFMNGSFPILEPYAYPMNWKKSSQTADQ